MKKQASNNIKAYYQLTKPGIIYGNAVAAMAGFFMASRGNINFVTFLAMLFGLSLVIGSACVFNNYLDQELDKVMARTKNRALVKGTISNRNALLYGSVLGILGALVLFLFTNLLTLSLGAIGFIFYVIIYGYAKRRSVHGTVIGSISGAIPPVAGYCSVTNKFDLGALLLFLILTFWQMPHFYAIGIYRLKDYTEAKVPILPVVKGVFQTKVQILIYIIGYLISLFLLYYYKYTGIIYLIVLMTLGLAWLGLSIKGFFVKDHQAWGKKIFLFSLILLLSFSLLISIDFK